MPETAREDASPILNDIPNRDAIYTPLGPSFFQLTLSPTNKAEILSEALSELSKSNAQTTNILQHLQTWSPSTSSLFTLRCTSTILSTPLRLIYPTHDLPAFTPTTGLYPRQYLAISYCWRSPSFLPQDYTPYSPWPIKKSLVDAILAEKPHPRVGIWMDQLSINQASAGDKRAAVAAMDLIYRSCLRLVVLLEDVQLSAAEIQLVAKYDVHTRVFDRTWDFEPEEIPVFAGFHAKVNGARWWTRAWCFHEFSVHGPWLEHRQGQALHNATFIVGGPGDSTVKIKWVNLQLLMGSAMYVLPDTSGWTQAQGLFSGVMSKLRKQHEDQYDAGDNGWRSSIMARHNGVSEMGSSVLEDRLSITMNLCGLALAYIGPPLQSPAETFYLCSLLALAAGETTPLTLMHPHYLTLYGAPTWLSNPSVAHDTTIPDFKPKPLTSIHHISPRSITLDMLFLTAPWRSLPPQTQPLSQTHTIFPTTIRTSIPKTHIPTASSRIMSIYNTPDTHLDLPRRHFLASCILHGAEFTRRLWTQIKHDIISRNYNTGAFANLAANPALLPAAQHLLALLYPVTTLLCLATPAEAWPLNDAALFLTWLTDPRSMYYIGLQTFWVPCGGNGDAVFVTGVVGNEDFGRGGEEEDGGEEVCVAVPRELLGESCIPMRVWILRGVGRKGGGGGSDASTTTYTNRPDNPSPPPPYPPEYRIVAKALLLGEPDLLQEALRSQGTPGANVILRERTVVCG
ncbi:hypothetical protein J1614_002857 [Plenodomus biglobosus]|nr:hypothetical protein J1614_002857 [Plenodomus biglobosus]